MLASPQHKFADFNHRNTTFCLLLQVTVLVRDVNDNPPMIHNSDLSHLTVSEDTPIGTTITVISVSDLDEGM